MERSITIEYWQELPSILEALKRASSQLAYDWNLSFDPTVEYVTSINFEDVRIRFKGDHWAKATRLYKLFCEEYYIDLNISNYIWLARHTKIINNALLGDEEFNRYVLNNGGMVEAEEFVKHSKLVIWHGEDFELYYNYRDMEMIQRLGMEVRPNQFQFRSKSGYYLPIKIHIKYNEILTRWLRGEGRNLNKYEIVHTPEFTILATEKSSLYNLAKYMYKEEGLSELIVMWVDELDKTEYKVTIGGTKVYIKDVWREENKEYVRTARRLNKVSNYQLEAFRIQDVLNHSNYDEDYGIELGDSIYNRLTINKDQLLNGLTHVKDNLYEMEKGSLGNIYPKSLEISDIKIKTPYKVIINGDYKGNTLPLLEDERYNEHIQEANKLDTNLRIVLRKSSIPREKTKFTFEDIYNYGEDSLIPLSKYPEIEVNLDEWGIDFTEGVTIQDKKLAKADSDFKYIPYIIGIEDTGEILRVTYIDGDVIEVSHKDLAKRARVVFKDRIGVEIDKDSQRLAELLMSLNTDKLEDTRFIEETDNKLAQELVDKWIDSMLTGNTKELYQLIQDYPLSSHMEDVQVDDVYDLFSVNEEEDVGIEEEINADDEEGINEDEEDIFDIFQEIDLL